MVLCGGDYVSLKNELEYVVVISNPKITLHFFWKTNGIKCVAQPFA